jgi:hypothetical protein
MVEDDAGWNWQSGQDGDQQSSFAQAEVSKAFSSKVNAGLRQENALKQESEASVLMESELRSRQARAGMR